jgi:hypothetical protein
MIGALPLLRSATVVLWIAIVGVACDGAGTTGPEPPASDEVARIAPRLGVMSLAVAAAPQGRGFFDNFLPCVRRGVIVYRNTSLGRAVTFHGCDLGEGIVVNGSGELRWAGSGLETIRGETFCRFDSRSCPPDLVWTGALSFDVEGSEPVQLDRFRIENLTLGEGGGAFPDFVDDETFDLGFISLTFRNDDARVEVDDPALPSKLFDTSGLALSSIPNSSGALASLTENDLRRIAFEVLMDMALFLLDETIDPRGPHEHALPCGVFRVDPGDQELPVIEADLRECDLAGIIQDGQFRFQWEELGDDGGTMIVEGEFELGGGVPRVELERVRWIVQIQGPGDQLEQIRVHGELEGPSDIRAFDYTLMVDD